MPLNSKRGTHFQGAQHASRQVRERPEFLSMAASPCAAAATVSLCSFKTSSKETGSRLQLGCSVHSVWKVEGGKEEAKGSKAECRGDALARKNGQVGCRV